MTIPLDYICKSVFEAESVVATFAVEVGEFFGAGVGVGAGFEGFLLLLLHFGDIGWVVVGEFKFCRGSFVEDA